MTTFRANCRYCRWHGDSTYEYRGQAQAVTYRHFDVSPKCAAMFEVETSGTNGHRDLFVEVGSDAEAFILMEPTVTEVSPETYQRILDLCYSPEEQAILKSDI